MSQFIQHPYAFFNKFFQAELYHALCLLTLAFRENNIPMRLQRKLHNNTLKVPVV
jgi:hypothetical protein